MTRTLVDSTNVADDPASAQMVAYYVDGKYATTQAAVRQRFPSAVLVPISALGTTLAPVGDVEPGCMTISQGVNFVQRGRAAGLTMTLYVNELNAWLACREAFTRAQVPEPLWFVADYDGIAVIPEGAIAKQYENPPLTGGHFDRSVVADFWPGIDDTYGESAGFRTHPLPTPILINAARRQLNVSSENSINLFGVATDGTLSHQRYDISTGTWSAWQSLGGNIPVHSIDASAQRGEQIDLFVRGKDTMEIYQISSSDDGRTWGAWQDRGHGIAGQAYAVSSYPAPAPANQPAPVDLSPVTTLVEGVQATADKIWAKVDKDLA